VTKKKRQGRVSLPRVVAIAIFTLVAILMVDFGRKALDSYQVQRQVEWLRQQVAVEQETNEELQEQLAYVSSDAYVEKIARERLKLVQPGESAVVVIPQSVETPVATAEGPEPGAPAEEQLPYWQQWADLLLGSEL
jgi:cell division protein DivIC